MKIAFVHEWIASYTGSEKVLAAMAPLYPDAPIYLTSYDPRHIRGTPLEQHPIHTSFLQRFPFVKSHHHLYLPLMPYAVEQHDLSAYDVVVSSSHSVAKGVLTRSDQLHISYVHTPMRYAWDLYFGYGQQDSRGRGVTGWAARWILHYVRLWDRLSADRVDVMIANSHHVARRIRKTYRRRARVVYPPVDVDRFRPGRKRDDFYLVVSRLVAYKRVDLIIEAFKQMDKPLVIIGKGPEEAKLRRLAGPTVRFVQENDDPTITDHMERCRGFVIAAEEDFGITAVEAQAAGAPVVAFGRGGTRETVVENKTGVFFNRQHPDDLRDAVQHLEATSIMMRPDEMRLQAQRFSVPRFNHEIGDLIDRAWSSHSTARGV